MFKNLKLRTQLNFGFGAVIVLLVILSITAWWGLQGAFDGFTEYRRMALNNLKSSEFQETMLRMRLDVRNFIISASDQSVQDYRGNFSQMMNLLKEMKGGIKNPERAQLVASMEEQVAKYDEAFLQVTTLTKERIAEVEHLGGIGTVLRQTITQMIDTADKDNNEQEVILAGRLQEQLLTGRLYMVKYLESHLEADLKRATEEMQVKVKEVAMKLRQVAVSPTWKPLLESFEKSHDDYLKWMVVVVDFIQKSDNLIKNTLDQIGPAITKAAQELRASYQKDQDALGPQVQRANEIAIAVVTWLAVAAILTGIFLAWLLVRIIQRPIGGEPARMAEITAQIATGDLTVRFTDTGKETGVYAAMRDMAQQLRDTVSQVIQSTNQVSSAAAEIAQGSADLSQRTEEQASALEETASSMEELTSTVKQSAENAGQANQLAGSARNQAEQGGQVVDQVVTAMSAINQSSRKIADIIGVIDEIAFQTNLLALNAAVEAARAGEQGRGFAVVAGEVRKLAQRSADAAKEIKSLITDSVAKVEDGSKLVDRAGQTLREIMTSVKKVSDIVAEMTAAAREQAGGIEQVNKAILQMDQVTQQNAALVEETAATSQSMGEQARELQRLMEFFKIDQRDIGAKPVPVANAARSKPAPMANTNTARSKLGSVANVSQGKSRTEPRMTGARVVKPAAKLTAKPALTEKKFAAHAASEEWEEF